MANLSCQLCYFGTQSQEVLFRHIVKYHKNDPGLKIECNENGCGKTFAKWKSYKRHVQRNHSSCDIIDDVICADNVDAEDIASLRDEENHVSMAEHFEVLQAQFLIKIRDYHKVSDTAISQIIDGVRDVVTNFSSMIVDEFSRRADPTTKSLHLDEVKKVLIERFPPEKLFSSIDTRYKLDKFLVEKMNMVMPEKMTMGTEMLWKKNRTSRDRAADLVEVERDAYIVPLYDSLKTLLQNKDVKYCVDNPRPKENEMLRTVLDGTYYRTHDFFKNNENALAIILYYDDLEIASPLGSKTSVHKLSMFYWSLANIYPELRSTLQTVNLFAIVKTQVMKKFGVDKILEKFAVEIDLLQTEGISIKVDGRENVYKGSLLFVAGDTPASALIGGFKESVAAFRFCRTCLTTPEQWKHFFSENEFELRNNEIHKQQIDNISQTNLTKQSVDYWKKRYGINRKSALLNIDDFDVTKCLPHDAMHILSEGVVEIAIRVLLEYCVLEISAITLKTLNDSISHFDFGHLQKNAPSAILPAHLMPGGHLRQSSSQMLTLAHTLPFLIGDLMRENNNLDLEERILCHVRLVQILNVCLSYEIHEEAVDTLERMIHVYILVFKRLYPNSLVPKFHFLIHIPRYIRLFGPARQQWCFRFESAHAYYKSLTSVVRNFKNMPKTLSYRHQALMCSRLNNGPNNFSPKFLYTGHQVFSGYTVMLQNLPIANLFHSFLDETEIAQCQMFDTNEVKIHGTSYKKGKLILLSDSECSLPMFGEILNIYVLKNAFYIVHAPLRTLEYCSIFDAYKIEKPTPVAKKIIQAEDLIFPHPLLNVQFGGEKYVILLNHCRTEFCG